MTSPEDLNAPAGREPYINYGLIALNLIVFSWELTLGSNLSKAAEVLGFIPARFLQEFSQVQNPITHGILSLFTSLFLHGNVLHLAPNILFLHIFGKDVETSLGHGRYLSLYLAAGVGANLIYLLFLPYSTVPLLGASGAIAGVMAAHLSLVPGIRLANIFIIVWVLLQFVYALFASIFKVAGQTGMAWWAHVGGFLIGLVLIRFLAPPGVWLIPLRSPAKRHGQD
ncbi:MAG: rhomboid family intramembrane serine protease [Deltaproteobacteria bacterium]|nr:rhomboid family intramembrane serine protease [Deltaproteobacteria bacterium]